MEYSNLGYAMLGRIITNVSQQPYKDYVEAPVAEAARHDVDRDSKSRLAPAERRALGYRWEDGAWRLEPTMAHGAFGAMGGLQTSANDYAKYVGLLLSAWPARDGADTGPVQAGDGARTGRRARTSLRCGRGPAAAARTRAVRPPTYGMGMIAAVDCDLGLTLSHGGGYPGYGSHVLLLPDFGVGIFALANRTYAGPRAPVWDAAVASCTAGDLKARPAVTGHPLSTAYARGRDDLRRRQPAAGGRAGDELPDGPIRRGLGARPREPQGAGRHLRDVGADRRHRRAVRRVHVALRARPRERDCC